jgi:transketolase
LIYKCAAETSGIVTAEDHSVIGGLGGAVAEVLVQHKPVPMEFVGVKDTFGESGEPEELASKYGIDSVGIVKSVNKLLGRL